MEENQQENGQHAKLDFESFYSKYYQKILYYLFKKTGSMQDAEDITCGVFMYCFEHRESFDPEKASPATWLYIIVNSRLKNWYRDRKPTMFLDNMEDFLSTDNTQMEDAIILQEQRDALAKTLLALPERERKIVVYRYFRGMHISQIAEIMDMSENNIRVTLSRAIDKMGGDFDKIYKK